MSLTNEYPFDAMTTISPRALMSVVYDRIFKSCEAPYTLVLEEGWMLDSTQWPAGLPMLKMAMSVLHADEKVLDVRFSNEVMEQEGWKYAAPAYGLEKLWEKGAIHYRRVLVAESRDRSFYSGYVSCLMLFFNTSLWSLKHVIN